jgi:hypothetical protein
MLFYTEITNSWVVAASTPMFDDEGKFLGAVGRIFEIGPVDRGKSKRN